MNKTTVILIALVLIVGGSYMVSLNSDAQIFYRRTQPSWEKILYLSDNGTVNCQTKQSSYSPNTIQDTSVVPNGVQSFWIMGYSESRLVDSRFGTTLVKIKTYWLNLGAAALLLSAITALALLRLIIAGKRHSQGVCSHCGYQLLPSQKQCPECGRLKCCS